MAQRQLVIQYEYDAAGNRILRKTVDLILQKSSVLSDSTETEQILPNEPLPHTTNLTPQTAVYFVEKIAQVEIKIYPNPTTEKITLEISEWNNLQAGIFKLYSLNGQLLQEQLVHSPTTTISLAGFAKGAYILKMQINGVTEDWKIIKH
jgi:hypothetical protein